MKEALLYQLGSLMMANSLGERPYGYFRASAKNLSSGATLIVNISGAQVASISIPSGVLSESATASFIASELHTSLRLLSNEWQVFVDDENKIWLLAPSNVACKSLSVVCDAPEEGLRIYSVVGMTGGAEVGSVSPGCADVCFPQRVFDYFGSVMSYECDWNFSLTNQTVSTSACCIDFEDETPGAPVDNNRWFSPLYFSSSYFD